MDRCFFFFRLSIYFNKTRLVFLVKAIRFLNEFFYRTNKMARLTNDRIRSRHYLFFSTLFIFDSSLMKIDLEKLVFILLSVIVLFSSNNTVLGQHRRHHRQHHQYSASRDRVSFHRRHI